MCDSVHVTAGGTLPHEAGLHLGLIYTWWLILSLFILSTACCLLFAVLSFKSAGGTLAHEVGHYLGLKHTWFEGDPGRPAQEQCTRSASMDVRDVVNGLSDGVRDTPAISLNTRKNSAIIRFVNCSTYEHTNNAPLMQQSCTTATANFPRGDRYYNPVSADGML
jgi:hypothetical protein